MDELTLAILLENTPVGSNTLSFPMKFPGFVRVLNLINSFAIVEMEPKFYNFLACDSKSSIDMLVYLEPFDASVWISLVVLIILTSLSVYIIFKICFPTTTVNYLSINLTISALLLNTTVYFRDLHENRNLQGIFAVWLLTSMVVNTGYRTNSFAKTIAPAEIQRLEKFSELKNFKLFAEDLCSIDDFQLDKIYCSQFSHDIAIWLMKRFTTIANNEPNVYNIYRKLGALKYGRDDSFKKQFGFKLEHDKFVLRIFRQIELVRVSVTSNVSVAQILTRNCKRSVFVLNNTEIKKVEAISNSDCNSPNKQFYSGNDAFLKKTGTWYIQENGGKYLIRRMRYFEYSGLYGFWKRLVNSRYKRRICSNNEKGLSLNSNMLALFYLIVFCLGMCIMICAGELCWKSRR
ncbi:unnamed protein product [Orchesella dallaii]|uniref:Uncharacterized protein n=1 Tax=Orchesella dallaii TaxID=48710 RepID=A0ABP1S9D7_9HEXA